MKRTFTFTVVAALAGMLAYSGIGFAAQGGIPGPPDDSGEPPDLGDIIVLYRDAWGLPNLTLDLCQQAIPADPLPDTCLSECVVDGVPSGVSVVAVNPDTCGIALGCETCTQEVDFGRTSVIRSPVSVIEQSLAEAVTKLATAQCTSLDPAGRLVNTSEIDGVVLSATIDSPLESLAIYWQLMRTGYLGAATMPIELPDANVLNTAARGLGAAADKTGKVNVDQVVYTNEILGLTGEAQTYLPKICMNVREEVQGVVQTVRKCFLNYGPDDPLDPDDGTVFFDYQYDRVANFLEVPAPPYIPAEDPQDGWLEYLGVWSEATDTEPDLFYIVQGPIMDNVFGDDPGFLDGNVGGFTQAADDTREVIEFTHDRPLPLGYETPVPLSCIPSTDAIYDVSISPDSGLQVPVRMVIGTEGREVILTVANAGPDTATGTATVVGIATNGQTVFNELVPFTLNAEQSQSWTWIFTIDFATTVNWTAEAIPDCATCDLNTANNIVSETTTVRGTGGGGRGRPRGTTASRSPRRTRRRRRRCGRRSRSRSPSPGCSRP